MWQPRFITHFLSCSFSSSSENKQRRALSYILSLYLHIWQVIKDSEWSKASPHPNLPFANLHRSEASGKLRCCEQPPVIRQSCLCTTAPCRPLHSPLLWHTNLPFSVIIVDIRHGVIWWQLIVFLQLQKPILATGGFSLFRCLNIWVVGVEWGWGVGRGVRLERGRAKISVFIC